MEQHTMVVSDEGIRMALGIDTVGMCCRHPNQPIYKGGGHSNGHHTDLVQTCLICDSESLAGGVRQRKSFALIIGQVNDLHASNEWKEFKKNWGRNSYNPLREENKIEEEAGEEKKDGTTVSQALARAASTRMSSTVRPIDVDDLTRQLTLRLTQVQDWLLKEREKELEKTKIDKDSTVSELQKQIKSMQLIIDGQNEKLTKLQQKTEKQQKTINQELRMIKMIALKRAGQGASPDISADRKIDASPNSESNRRASTGIIMQSTTARSDLINGNASAEFTMLEAPPRRPERKRSEFDPGPGNLPKSENKVQAPSGPGRITKSENTARPSATDLRCVSELVQKQQQEQQLQEIVLQQEQEQERKEAPRLPIRQTSHQAGSIVHTTAKQKKQQPRKTPTASIQRKVSLNNEKNFSQPPVPLRVHIGGGGADTTGRSARTGIDSHDTMSAMTSSVIDESVASSGAPSSVPTFVSASTPDGSNAFVERPMPQPGLHGASRREIRNLAQPGGKVFTSIMKNEFLFTPEEGNEEASESGSMLLPLGLAAPAHGTTKSKPGLSHEISFTPFVADDIPPPPPPSREIDFDASREFDFSLGSPGIKRPSIVADMQFDSSQQLLFEASKALSDVTTPLAVHHKTLRKMGSASNRGKAPKKDIEFGVGPGSGGALGVESNHRISVMSSSAAQEYAANPDSLLNQSKSTTPIPTSRKSFQTPQEFSINLAPSIPAVQEGNEEVEESEKPPEEDAFDEDDYFNPADFPPELPLDEHRYLTCTRSSENQSPFSDFSTGSYLLDQQLNEEFGDQDDEDEDEPRKGLGGGVTKQLPLEADLDFDSESDDDKDEDDKAADVKSKDGSDNTGNIPARHQSIMRSPKLLSATPSILRAAAFKGASAEADEIASKPTYHVEQETVQDKYGDGGEYSGSVSVEDSLPHGFGIMKYDNDRQYEGDWSDGRWHGNGRWVNPNGDCYEGTFVYDTRHGSGTYTWKNGNVYRGAFFEDKRQGKGTFNFANGNVYTGDFVNGVFEGVGRYEFEGGYFEGQWKSGRYHGHGFLLFADGSSYKGEFSDGVAHGQGEETCIEGTVRKGYWENGKPVAVQ